MPLQNRVNPFGELCAFSARGLFMGNRGGRFHTDAKTLTARRWASRQWICCVLDFKGRRRDVWGRFYTELFFLYEPTRLAASSAAAKTRRRLARSAPVSQAAIRSGDGQRAARRLFRRTRQTPAQAQHRRIARWRIYCARWNGLRRSLRHTPTLDAGWLRCSRAAAAPHRCRCADPTDDSRRPVSWLRTALAPKLKR